MCALKDFNRSKMPLATSIPSFLAQLPHYVRFLQYYGHFHENLLGFTKILIPKCQKKSTWSGYMAKMIERFRKNVGRIIKIVHSKLSSLNPIFFCTHTKKFCWLLLRCFSLLKNSTAKFHNCNREAGLLKSKRQASSAEVY